jgi:hypothetical protein
VVTSTAAGWPRARVEGCEPDGAHVAVQAVSEHGAAVRASVGSQHG